jgi:hypothetical protein
VVTPTENLISDRIWIFGITNDNLLALCDHLSESDTRIMSGPATAPAERLYLKWENSIGQFDEPRRPREHLGAKVSENAKCVNIDT